MKKLFILLSIVATFSVAGYSQTYHYDVDGDGAVTAADVTAVYNYLMGLVPSDGHEYVNLGLPSGTLWATTNIGATNPEDYGVYFAWGETELKNDYTWDNYMWCNGYWDKLTKYCNQSSYGYNGFTDDLAELVPEDDAAYVNWGPNWRMPSKDQIIELVENCTWEWTTMNGVNGRLFTSNFNGAQLFLPAAGYIWSNVLKDGGTKGYYWGRSLNVGRPDYGSSIYLSESNVTEWGYGRAYGYPIRPVRASQK